MSKTTVTHEQFVNAVAALAIGRIDDAESRAKLAAIKLVYGAGQAGLRGVTYYQRWQNGDPNQAAPFVEVCAMGEESWIQLAGTTIHELGHVLAGFGAGHGPDWKAACERLGLRRIKAAGTNYCLANFDPGLRLAIAALARPSDGQPVSPLSALFPAGLGGKAFRIKPCGAGIGVRGGKSRGIGSGSRLRLWQCSCGCKVRVASDDFAAVHTPCGEAFTLQS